MPSWWKPGDPLTKEEEEVVADALASRSGSVVVDDNDDKDDNQGDVAKGKKRKHHWPRWKSKSGCASSLNTSRVLAGLVCNVFGMRSGARRVKRRRPVPTGRIGQEAGRGGRAGQARDAFSFVTVDKRGPRAVRRIARVPDEGDRIVNGSGPSLFSVVQN